MSPDRAHLCRVWPASESFGLVHVLSIGAPSFENARAYVKMQPRGIIVPHLCIVIFNKRGIPLTLTARRKGISINIIISRINSESRFRSSLPRSIIIYVRTNINSKHFSSFCRTNSFQYRIRKDIARVDRC